MPSSRWPTESKLNGPFVPYCFVWIFLFFVLLVFDYIFRLLICVYACVFLGFICLFLKGRKRMCEIEWLGRWEVLGGVGRGKKADYNILYYIVLQF